MTDLSIVLEPQRGKPDEFRFSFATTDGNLTGHVSVTGHDVPDGREPDEKMRAARLRVEHLAHLFPSQSRRNAMPSGPKGQKRPTDVIGNAIRVAQIATGEVEGLRHVKRLGSGKSWAGVVRMGLSRWAFLLVKGNEPAHRGSRTFNDLAGSRSPGQRPETCFTCPT